MIWNPKQKQVINTTISAIHNSKSDTIKLFVHGGKGAGKSVAMLWLINLICERTPGISALVVRKTFKGLKTDTMNILKRDPYPGILTGVKGKWANGIEEFHYDNGSVIYFSHLENNTELTHGPSMGLIYVEQIELCAQEDYEMLKLRLRQYTLNDEYSDRYKEFIDKHQLFPCKNYLLLNANPRAGWCKKAIYQSNEFLQISLPTSVNSANLPQDYINPFASESYKERHYEGSWSDLSGLIYTEFLSRNQIASNFLDKLIINEQNNYIVLDPGFVTSKFAVLFACVLSQPIKYGAKIYPAGTILIYDELSFNGKDSPKTFIKDIATSIKARLKHYGISDYIGLIDPAANRLSTLGPSETQQLISEGLHLINAHKTQEQASFDKINSMLAQESIIVSLNCLNFLQEIESYSYKLTDESTVDPKEQPENKNNDFMDCFKYLINQLPYSINPPKRNRLISQEEQVNRYNEWVFADEKIVTKSPTNTPYIKGLTYGLPNV